MNTYNKVHMLLETWAKSVFAQLYSTMYHVQYIKRSKIQIDTYHTAFMLTYRKCFPC